MLVKNMELWNETTLDLNCSSTTHYQGDLFQLFKPQFLDRSDSPLLHLPDENWSYFLHCFNPQGIKALLPSLPMVPNQSCDLSSPQNRQTSASMNSLQLLQVVFLYFPLGPSQDQPPN